MASAPSADKGIMTDSRKVVMIGNKGTPRNAKEHQGMLRNGKEC